METTHTAQAAKRPTRNEALQALRTFLSWLGEDPDREGLADTPERVLRAWEADWGRGYRQDPKQFVKLFVDDRKYDQMIVVRDISFFSHCEHHLTPFFGKAAVAYIADERGVIGLSKIARIVDHFSRRLQIQERLTEEIADFLAAHVSGKGVGVVVEATHMCMLSRGVRQPNAKAVTSALGGVFLTDAQARSEFLALVATP